MRPAQSPLIPKALLAGLFAAAFALPVLYLYVALSRLAYPYELEWMEGGAADHVVRLLTGRPLYVTPSLDFVPFIYPPLYFYLCAPLARLTGAVLASMRVVSFAASLGCLALIAALVRREVRAWRPAFLAAALYAGVFPLCGFWFDVARVDSLFMLLLLGGIYALRGATGARGLSLAGGLFALAFLTKQTALMIAAPLAVYTLIFFPGRQRFIFPATLGALAGLATLLLNHASGGWFRYYIFDLPRQHPLDFTYLKGFWMRDLVWPLPVACAVALFFFVQCFRRRRLRDLAFFGLLGGGMLGAAWSSRLHSAGFNNVLLPAYAFVAITFGPGIGYYAPSLLAISSRVAQGKDLKDERDLKDSTGSIPKSAGDWLTLLLCAVQFMALTYDPGRQIPTAFDRSAGDAFIRQIKAIPGDIFVPLHGYLTYLAGKPMHAQAMAISDVLRGADTPPRRALERELREAHIQRRFAAIVSDGDWQPGLLEKYYPQHKMAFDDWDSFYTRIGMKTRPTLICTPPATSNKHQATIN